MTIALVKPVSSPKPRNSVVKPFALSHGTCECYNIEETRKFYAEFLGLDCVRISRKGIAFSLGLKFHVVCLETGVRPRPAMSLYNHWGVEVASAEEVREAYASAQELKEKYKIGIINPIEMVGGRYSFYFEDLDHNWWEIQYYKGFLHDDFYDFGDMA